MRELEVVDAGQLERVLALVLASGGRRRASRAHVSAFVDYLSACELSWTAFCDPAHRDAVLFVLLLPGKTAIVMLPKLAAIGLRPAEQDCLLRGGLARLAGQGLYYAQTLIEPEATDKQAAVRRVGFRHLTRLVYLQRAVATPPWQAPRPEEARWVSYRPEGHDAFVRVLAQTYEDSRDCPELSGLRPPEAAIASHRAAGLYDPSLWELAYLEDEAAGCVLSALLPDGGAAELVYMGVVPHWRRRGVGTLLLRRALAQAAARDARTLTAVADERNTPARNLYERFGFAPTAVRAAYIYTW